MKTCVPVKEGGMGRLARHEPDVFTRDQGMSIFLVYFVVNSKDHRQPFGGLNTAITGVGMCNVGGKVRALNFDEQIPVLARLPGQ